MQTTLKTYIERYGMADHYDTFMRYARTFYTGKPDHDAHLSLKVTHSHNVFCDACAIAEAEAAFTASPELTRALALAGLYHDFGRFMQYARYKTFSDASSVNHARLAVHEAKLYGVLQGEEKRVRNLALTAVLLHNRFAVPPRLNKDALAVANAVRDADKLDIMRIMSNHFTNIGPMDSVVTLSVKDSPEVSPVLLQSLMERRTGLYSDLRTTTDFKLLICTWYYDLNYAFSRKTALAEEYLRALFESLPVSDALVPFKERFMKDTQINGA